MSSVYRAHDTVLERRVAIKVLHEHYSSDPEYVERFRREARAIARLAHPNVVTVIDRGEWDGRQFIVFEHVAGENLKAAIERVGALPVRRALVLCDPDRACARLRARARDRPPRREAAQRPARPRRRGEGDRLRHRADARRRGGADADRHRARNRPVPLPRAGERRARRRALRPVLARRRHLRAADGRGAVHRREPDGDRDAPCERPGAERARAQARGSGAPGLGGGVRDGEEPGGQVPLHAGDGGVPRGLPRRASHGGARTRPAGRHWRDCRAAEPACSSTGEAGRAAGSGPARPLPPRGGRAVAACASP